MEDVVTSLLKAIEPPARLRPRDRLQLGLLKADDDNNPGVNILCSAAIASLENGNDSMGIRCLLALGELCKEVECSELLGLIGGHQSVLHLMMEGPQMDETNEGGVQDAVELVAAHVVSSGCIFPMRPSFPGENTSLPRFPLRHDFVVTDHKISHENEDVGLYATSTMTSQRESSAEMAEHMSDANLHKNGEDIAEVGTSTGGEDERSSTVDAAPSSRSSVERSSKISVLIRQISERQHSQFDVGFQMWPSATILSRWLCRNPDKIRGRSVLEVGAGLGLCGLVAANIAATVTLTDYNPVVLRVLEANVALNTGWHDDSLDDGDRHDGKRELEDEGAVGSIVSSEEERAVERVAIDCSGRVRVRRLDWNALHDGKPNETRDGATTTTDRVENDGMLETINLGNRFDIIIASDHICQTSDAKGTVRVLQSFLAKEGHAHFVVAHPRTRFGVDALFPLLQQSPGLEFTCKEVGDHDLTAGLDEAAYLAWLYVHVWWADGTIVYGRTEVGRAKTL